MIVTGHRRRDVGWSIAVIADDDGDQTVRQSDADRLQLHQVLLAPSRARKAASSRDGSYRSRGSENSAMTPGRSSPSRGFGGFFIGRTSAARQ
jgi:hypothetical protein